ncbi:hypothetical protein [Celeribacter halophilus]|uniref:hypothetical protein n=1 Tax=Celeribacter halophilus TaxID=576117 RepID=UPI000A6299A7|nr:hypothetical protein [Celeribacter halophilus]
MAGSHLLLWVVRSILAWWGTCNPKRILSGLKTGPIAGNRFAGPPQFEGFETIIHEA